MTAKRYFKRMWEEEYYIFDSNTISESDFEEKLEYQNYKAFEDSMMGDEVVNRLNGLDGTVKNLSDDYEQLLKENKELKDKNSRLQETLAFRSNQLALMEQLIDDLGSEEMARQMELILND